MQNNNAWENYEEQNYEIAESKKHRPPVPEPQFYGFVLTGLCLGFLIWRRLKHAKI